MIRNTIKKKDFSALIGNRRLYIWGSGHLGVSIYYAMLRIGIKVSGFLDSNMSGSEFLSFKVKRPDEILSDGKDNSFVILSSFVFAESMAKRCDEFGFSHSKDYLTHADMMPNFEIDVAGYCNLRCLTCPRGNAPKIPDAGMMSLANYKNVLDKLMIEIPLLSNVQLYSWGEPLLNPELPQIISYTSSKGLASSVSSNLSLRCDLESVVKAMPTWFRVSLSGYDDKSYSRIHHPGNFKLVVDNLKRLSQLRAQFAPKLFIEVNYHLYKHNCDGVDKMSQLCTALGFAFRINYAYIDPLDSIIEYAKGTPLPDRMEEGRQQLLLDIDDAIRLSQQSDSHECISENSFVIHSDLSFRRCNHLYNDTNNIIAENFLNTPLDEILHNAESCETCRTCRSLGVHRFHFAYMNKEIE